MFVWSNVKSAERFAIWCRNKQLFIVSETKLRRPWNVGASIGWKSSRVDELAGHVSGEVSSSLNETYFCLKYRSPLQSAAMPDEASRGIRKYDTKVSRAVPMLAVIIWGVEYAVNVVKIPLIARGRKPMQRSCLFTPP